jgi:NAD-dependent dihydropyrimidine dehydrogenase PreA subunit
MQLQAQEGLLFTYRSGLSSRGLLAWVVALGLTAFYLALYFTEIFTPLALALGLPSKWTLYGALYTLVMIGGGARYLSKHGSSRYNRVRIGGAGGAGLRYPSRRASQPTSSTSYLWLPDRVPVPGDVRRAPIYLGIYSVVASFVAVPILTLRYGKRWYCSWVCGCGALANTFGDPWRHLSSKSERAWTVEKITVHSTLALALITTVIVAANWAFGATHPDFAAFGFEVQRFYGFFVGAILSGIVGVAVYPILGPRVWCRYFCPMAALLGLLQKLGRFRVAVKPDMCIACGNCSTYCEMGIDVRAYAMRNQSFTRASCVGCGMCSHVCPRGVLRLDTKGAAHARLPVLPSR